MYVHLVGCLTECLQGIGIEYEEWRPLRRQHSLDRVDSRAWAGLLSLPFLEFLSNHPNYAHLPKHIFDRDIKLSLEILMSYTIPAAHVMWTLYTEHADLNNLPPQPEQQQAQAHPEHPTKEQKDEFLPASQMIANPTSLGFTPQKKTKATSMTTLMDLIQTPLRL